MSADSRPRFAPTLVRRGPVMRRSGRSPDAMSSGSRLVSGSKRSVKDRLGDRPDDSSEARSRQKDKRQKGKQNHESCQRNSSNDTRVTKGDLRLKLMEKKDPLNDVDLRDKLSSKLTLPPSDGKRSHPPKATSSKTTRSRLETQDMSDDEQQNVDDRTYESERQSKRECRGSGGGQSTRELRGSRGGQSTRELGDSVGGQSMHEHRDNGRGQSQREFRDSPRRQNIRELGANVCRQSMQELGDTDGRQRMGEVRETVGRQSRHKFRDGVGWQSMGELLDSCNAERQSRQEPSVYSGERRNPQKSWDTYNSGTPNMLDTRDYHDHGRQGVPCQIPSRIGSDLPAVGLVRTSYPIPSWMPETLTRRSPDRMSCSSMTRTFSPERNPELQRRPFFKTYDDGSSSVHMRNEVASPHTIAGSGIYMNQPPLNALPPMHAAPVPFSAQFPQSTGVIMRTLNPGEQPTVIGFLQSLGLEKYAINFQHEEVDFHTLKQMTDSDLKELHIPMGPRKKILQAMLPPPRR